MFILPTQEAVQEMMGRLPEAPFVMLNLYRLRDVADYSAYPELAPKTLVSGRELFARRTLTSAAAECSYRGSLRMDLRRVVELAVQH